MVCPVAGWEQWYILFVIVKLASVMVEIEVISISLNIQVVVPVVGEPWIELISNV